MTTAEIKALPSYKSMRRISWMVCVVSLFLSLSTGYLSLLGCIAGCSAFINNNVYLLLMLLNPFILLWLIRFAYFQFTNIANPTPHARRAFILRAFLLVLTAIAASTPLIGILDTHSPRLLNASHLFDAATSIFGAYFPLTAYVLGLFVLINKAIDALLHESQQGTKTALWLKTVVIFFIVAGIFSFSVIIKDSQSQSPLLIRLINDGAYL